ncbi:MAG: multiheme c-type cytochrome, partial [Myxococcales bacterium]
GVHTCVECHQQQVEFWAQTRHAHAYETLLAVKKQYSLDCIRCHVTGWQQSGGVCRIDRTEFGGPGVPAVSSLGDTKYRAGVGRRDVQCEDCHGPGSEHLEDPTGHIRAEVAATVCMRCHEPANSPKFDYAKYRPFIVGPGHGEPLRPGQKPKPREGVPE